ncbi:Cu2+-exporting ATPase [Andreprevotia lacus DSM 23236]|jgi:Cu2+-exporting ATPase|uniref:Cu2+-exporting ATPase n=1 Tax=Andreprevotia lacus DSM 23236 TaxID=1121001 RepID=A0A1W1XF27_9NEIS|nr:heavy metal translocating P-type ATPase [Andreprevotia lacus]SMC22121.1 Cu2+-exporting ATPase [Andreprevotia lacus DSM 23236]
MIATTAATACFHCGEPVPPDTSFQIHYRTTTQPACCAGCEAVAQSIIDAGLDAYYAQREQPAARAQPLPDELRQQLQLYDDPGLQQSFVHAAENEREAALLIEGITCAACIWLNERQIGRLPGVLGVSINYTSHRARVRWDATQTQLSTILNAVAAIGYQAQPYDQARQEQAREKARKSALLRLWIAGLSMMQVMMFTVPVYLTGEGNIDAKWLLLLNIASFAMTLPVVLFSSLPFYRSAWRDLRLGRTGMDLPVSIGVLAAFIASSYSLLTGHGAIYFDSVGMFVFLLLGGRYLEQAARLRAGAALERLVKLTPAFAHHLPDWPARDSREVAVGHLQAGDVVLVRAGETFAADGIVLEGQSAANEALLTGESAPVSKQAGSKVVGGSINGSSPLVVQIDATGEQTRLAGIVRLLDRALAEKPRIAEQADRIAGGFVAALLLVALAAWLFWHWHDPAHALPIAIAVLVISCPCALSLATPVALTAATGRLAQLGLLVSRGHALAGLAHVSDVVFDKTGTLTLGTPSLTQTIPLAMTAQDGLARAAALEHASEHPLALAFRSSTSWTASEIHNHPGGGLTGLIDGVPHAIGHASFVAQHCHGPAPAELMPGAIYLVDAQRWLAGFVVADALRDDAAATVAALQQAGKQVHLLSGDRQTKADEVATQIGINHVRAEATPSDKLAYLQQLQRDGARVLMVGDGVNDAPVLAAADISIAMANGVDVAQASGDAVLLENRLSTITQALHVATATRRIIRQNLTWALGYNLIALPLALAGLVTPWLASLGMASSSLLVVLNALRLVRSGAR